MTVIEHQVQGSTLMDLRKYLSPLDLPACAQRFQHAEPFPSICIDNFLCPDFAEEVIRDFPTYEEAQQQGRGFKAVNERGKFQVTDARLFRGSLAKLHEVFASGEFLEVMSTISGIPQLMADPQLVGGGVHQTGPRGHLDVHVDFNYITERSLHRRLNIILFLNKEWDPSWGGALELWDQQVRRCYHTFLPQFNRCVVFQTSEISYHGVTAVTCPEGKSRKSFAAYYYTDASGTNLTQLSHSTIFRARPHERWKRWVAMPVERFRRSIRRKKRELGTSLKRLVGR